MPKGTLVGEDLVVVSALRRSYGFVELRQLSFSLPRSPPRPHTHLVRLVAEEVNFLPVAADVLQRVRLVPAHGKHVKANLPANAKREAVVGKLLLERGNEGCANLVDLVERLKVVAFLEAVGEWSELLLAISAVETCIQTNSRGIPSDGRDVDHAVAELDERSSVVLRQRRVSEA